MSTEKIAAALERIADVYERASEIDEDKERRAKWIFDKLMPVFEEALEKAFPRTDRRKS